MEPTKAEKIRRTRKANAWALQQQLWAYLEDADERLYNITSWYTCRKDLDDFLDDIERCRASILTASGSYPEFYGELWDKLDCFAQELWYEAESFSVTDECFQLLLSGTDAKTSVA